MARSPDSPGIRVPPPILFLAGFLTGMAIDALLALPRFTPPPLLGPALIVLGAAIGSWAVATFLRHRTGILPHHPASAVVTAGPYRFSRNPMYVALAIAYLGAATRLGRIGPICTLLPALGVLSLTVIAREERYLATKFAGAYDAYRRRVRRWL
jgi:protein-S-isoprenylcysteine O-methyltransferase Ste14